MRANIARRHVRVGIDPGPVREPLALHHARPIHPLAHRRTRLATTFARESLVLHRRHFQMDVDAIEERPRDPRQVSLHDDRSACAIVVRIAEPAAGAGIHRGGQHEARRVGQAHRRARDRHDAILHRLA